MTSTTGGGFVPPKVISLKIVNAAIRPWDPNKEEWDDTVMVSPNDISLLEAAAGIPDPGEAYAQVSTLLANWTLEAYAPPDSYGTATLSVNGQDTPIVLASQANAVQDKFLPDWPGPPGWLHVPVTPQMTVQVQLIDKDLVNDDPIGTVQLTYDDLMAATQNGEVYEIRAATQGFGTVLFVGVAVTVEQP